jgi:cytochrome c biogenesis protein CcmG, thiol:disulfide interchange protein DsbE
MQSSNALAARFAACIVGLGLAFPAMALQAGTPAPDFSTKLIAEPASEFKLSQLKGKVVYVDFWASWCAPCRVSFPILDALGAKHGAQGFMVVGVNQDDAAKDRDAFRKRVPVSFALVEDADHKIAKSFDVKAMPSGYLIDRKGVVRYVHAGFDGSSRDKLDAQIVQLLKEAP